MTTLSPLITGDSRAYQLEFRDSVTNNPVDITDSVIKFTAKVKLDDANNKGRLYKATHLTEKWSASADPGIVITDAVNGLAEVAIVPGDTEDMDTVTLRWDVELIRRVSLRTQIGTVSIPTVVGTEELVTLTFTGADMSLFRNSDILVLSGAQPGNSVSVVIEDINVGASTVTTDALGFNAESGVGFQLYKSTVNTPTGMQGTIRICQGVTI